MFDRTNPDGQLVQEVIDVEHVRQLELHESQVLAVLLAIVILGGHEVEQTLLYK